MPYDITTNKNNHVVVKWIISIVCCAIMQCILASCETKDSPMDVVMRSGEYCTATDFMHNIDFDRDKLTRQCLSLSPSKRVSCRRECIADSRSYYISRQRPKYTARDCTRMTDKERRESIGMTVDECIDYYVSYCVDRCISLLVNH